MIYLDSMGDECDCEECREAAAFRASQWDRFAIDPSRDVPMESAEPGGSGIDPWERQWT